MACLLSDYRSKSFTETLLSSSLLCSSFHSLVIDVTMALDTLSLPVLEPLSPSRLQDVTVLSLSCLYAGEKLQCLVSFSQSVQVYFPETMRSFWVHSPHLPLLTPFPQGSSNIFSRWKEASTGILQVVLLLFNSWRCVMSIFDSVVCADSKCLLWEKENAKCRWDVEVNNTSSLPSRSLHLSRRTT